MAQNKDGSPEELLLREKICEPLQPANEGSMEDIHELFKETIGKFMENSLEAELDEELGSGKYRLLQGFEEAHERPETGVCGRGLVVPASGSGATAIRKRRPQMLHFYLRSVLECVSKMRHVQFRVDLPAVQGDFPQA